MRFHPQGEGPHSAQHQPGIQRVDRSAQVLVDSPLRRRQPLPAHQAAADHVGMPIEVFARRVNDPIRSEIERTLIEGRRHRVIDNNRGAGPMRPRRRFLDVDEAHEGIGRCFQQHGARPGHRRQPRVRVCGIDDLHRNTINAAENLQQFKASSVNVLVCDQRAVAPLQPRCHGAQHRGAARTGD